MEILRGASLCITQCMDEERRCAKFFKGITGSKGEIAACILRQNEVLELIQIACTLLS